MKKTEIELIRHAINLLSEVAADDEPRATDTMRRDCPVLAFVERYLEKEPLSELSSNECWQFFAEVASAGDLPLIRRSLFLYRLPIAMKAVYNIGKSHNVRQGAGRVRGFRGISIREKELQPGVA